MADKDLELKATQPRVEHDDDPKVQLHLLQDAQTANAEEHNTTLAKALKENWKAAMWSAIISLTIVMEGYDQRYRIYAPNVAAKKLTQYSLMSNFFGYPTFQRRFGSYVSRRSIVPLLDSI
jgi:SP family general alpha glucoside:H+ symporter-like MFS transporter